MPKDLKKEIENHLATWPDRHNDFLEMKKEWEEFKSKALWTMVTFIGSILIIGIWVGTMNSRLEQAQNDVAKSLSHHDDYEKRIGSLEINNSEIRTRLTAIEVTLQEIKTAIIRLQ
jgi:hypothetical protein